MPKLYLTRNRVLEITDEQSMYLAKCIVLLPAYKGIQIGATVFTVAEIDLEAKRQAELPQQMKLDVRVKTVVVDKPTRKQQKGVDSFA